MSNKNEITDKELSRNAINAWGEKEGVAPGELRLMLLELLVKAQAGYFNSHTEEAFLRECNVTLGNRKPNGRGRELIMQMCYAPSNKRSPMFELSKKYRQGCEWVTDRLPNGDVNEDERGGVIICYLEPFVGSLNEECGVGYYDHDSDAWLFWINDKPVLGGGVTCWMPKPKMPGVNSGTITKDKNGEES